MPRSRNLCPEAPKPGIVDFNKKIIKKRSVFKRGAELWNLGVQGEGANRLLVPPTWQLGHTMEQGPPQGGFTV